MSVTKPPITVIGTSGHNIWAGRGLAHKLAVVCHIMEGSLSGCDSWFSNPAAQASSNYGVGKDGAIHQYVDPEGPDAPFANGIVQNPAATFQKLAALTGGVNPNYWTVSIEHEGHTGDVLTDAQLATSAQLTAWLCSRFGIPADEDHLLGHFEIDSVSRAHCPGWDRAGWLRYEAAVSAALQPADPCGDLLAQLQEAQAQLATANAALTAAEGDLRRQTGIVAAVRAAIGG